MTIHTIEEKYFEWGGFDKIFLSSGDSVIFETIKRYFGDKLPYIDIDRITLQTDKWLSDVYDQMTKESDKEKYERLLGRNLPTGLMRALIAPEAGANGIIRIKDKFESTYFLHISLIWVNIHQRNIETIDFMSIYRNY